MKSDEKNAAKLSNADAASLLKAMKLIAASDVLTRHELDALAAFRIPFPVDDATWHEVETFDSRGVALDELLPKIDGATARRWLHGAITMCWADDIYSVQEQAHVTRAATVLGLTPSLKRAMEALVVMERSVVELRRGLCEEP